MAYFIPRKSNNQKTKKTVRSVSRSTVFVALPTPHKMSTQEVSDVARQRNVGVRTCTHFSENEWTVVVYDPTTNAYAQWGDDTSGKGSFSSQAEAERVAQDARRKLGNRYNVLVNPPGR